MTRSVLRSEGKAIAATELALGRGERTPQIGVEPATSLVVRDSTARPPA